MDRLIGTFHIDTAKTPHQQASDQRGDRIRDLVGQHHSYHQRKAEQRMGCLGDSGCHFVHFGG
ncbi:Uncharacterised protein [Serratia fonticola]|uniref:Uncharacterized protein n=1 Tax=Serratia fonticola TaxID=47917 RepID=A0A4V6KUJ1_SERFO|nr:Uncharacterised protein [Serratia fonticola]